MVKDPIRRHEAAVSDAAVLSRTGRAREEWFALLDEAGAQTWNHRQIVAWLAAEHEIDGWWRQSITVGYEQARGLRAPGQRADSTFEANVSRTVAAPADTAFAWVQEPEQRSRWLDAQPAERPTKQVRTALWTWRDGTRVTVQVTPLLGDRSRVALSHGGLTDADALSRAKAYWSERMDALKTLVAEG